MYNYARLSISTNKNVFNMIQIEWTACNWLRIFKSKTEKKIIILNCGIHSLRLGIIFSGLVIRSFEFSNLFFLLVATTGIVSSIYTVH